jgi:hypothetical protein
MTASPWDAKAAFMGFLTVYPTPERFKLLDLMGTRAILVDGRRERRAPALAALLERLELRWLEGDDLAALDPEGGALANVNTPEDYARLAAREPGP